MQPRAAYSKSSNPTRMLPPCAIAKRGVIGFTQSLSIELGPDNIRVHAILPGLVAGDRQMSG